MAFGSEMRCILNTKLNQTRYLRKQDACQAAVPLVVQFARPRQIWASLSVALAKAALAVCVFYFDIAQDETWTWIQ